MADNYLKSVVFVMGLCSKVSPLEVRAMADLSTLGSLVTAGKFVEGSGFKGWANWSVKICCSC